MTATLPADLPPAWLLQAGWLGGAIAAAACLVLLIEALLRRRNDRPISYTAALAATAIWLLAETVIGWAEFATTMAEIVRNLSWIWFMASIAGRRDDGGRLSTLGWVYVTLFSLNLISLAMLLLSPAGGENVMVRAMPPVNMLAAAGALVLLHNLYASARPDERRALALAVSALGGMWAYDLNLYAISYLSREPALLMQALRPAAAMLIILALAISAVRPEARAIRLSRPVAFRSLAIAAIAGWLMLLAAAASLAGVAGQDFGARAQVVILLCGLALSAALLLSTRIRASLRVWVAKHFFEHRYDYRSEWLRFSGTLHRARDDDVAVEARIVQALADMVESPGGALIAADDDDQLTLAGGLPGLFDGDHVQQDMRALADWMCEEDRIIQFDEVRNAIAPAAEMALVPDWMREDTRLWMAIPLVHQSVARGIILLMRGPLDRALDWEDFDLLRVAGRQAASHLAEARGAAALLESQRFEEFHRRFAFVMHDVKNLASQLGVLARNIERHGENPDFRRDMTATVKEAAERLQSLTARLAEQDRVRAGNREPFAIAEVVHAVANAKTELHPVTVELDRSIVAMGDRQLAQRLLAHIVQNAIDASPVDAPVTIRLAKAGDSCQLHIIDAGPGMSAEFIRTSLFRPFVSTKDGGFGIGAFQARQLAEAMGGTLSVTSREGEGSCFTLSLPLADAARKVA